MLLFNRSSDSRERMLWKCPITMVFTYFLPSWCKFSTSFRGKNTVVVSRFTFHIFIPLGNYGSSPFKNSFLLRTKSCPDLYLPIRSPRRPSALGRGKLLIPLLIRSPPMLAVYDVAHSLPLGVVGMNFSFSESKTRKHFPTRKTPRELLCYYNYSVEDLCSKLSDSLHIHGTPALWTRESWFQKCTLPSDRPLWKFYYKVQLKNQ